MIITLALLSVFSTLLTLVVLFRTGRIIQDQDNQSNAFIQAVNFQTKKLKELTGDVHHALDCLLTADYKAVASIDTN